MTGLLGTDRRIRVLLTCTAALLAANAAVITSRWGSESGAPPAAVVAEEGTGGTVLIMGADGKTLSVDPTTAEGKAAIAAAEERGDTIISSPAGDPDGAGPLAATSGDDRPSAAKSAADLDAADGVVDGIIKIVDQATGDIIERTVEQVEDAIDKSTNVTTTTTPTKSTDGDGGDEPLVTVTTPGVTVTIPGVEVTTPPVSVTTPPVTVTTPPVSVTTPPVTVGTPITTITVPTTTVTVPTTTVTVPPTTVTVPSVTVTVPPTTVTVAPVTVTVTTVPSLGL